MNLVSEFRADGRTTLLYNPQFVHLYLPSAFTINVYMHNFLIILCVVVDVSTSILVPFIENRVGLGEVPAPMCYKSYSRKPCMF